MTLARDAIFEALEAARPPAAAATVRVPQPEMPSDPKPALAARLVQAGGTLQSVTAARWSEEIEWPIPLKTVQHRYVDARVAEKLPPLGAGLETQSVHALAPLEVCVLHADFAVVENGAAWHVPKTPFDRAAALLAEHLVLLVEATALVPSLHQAYERIDLNRANFGWFLCGPSKTADIEQALVLGAHGPRTMSLVLLEPA